MATPEDIVLNQYAKLRSNLKANQDQARTQTNQGIARQQAITGVDSGTGFKIRQKAEHDLNVANQTGENTLGANEAAANLDIAKTREAQAYGTSERQASQTFQAGQTEKAQQYGTSERQASQSFAAGEAQLGRAFTTQERSAVQDFQNAQRLGAQDFQSAEQALGRTFTTAERQAIQAYQSGEAQTQRQFATGERVGTQQFQSAEAQKQRDTANYQFIANLGFQKDSFGASLALQNREFDANVATNAFNAEIAAYQAKDFLTHSGDFGKWRDLLSGFGITSNPNSYGAAPGFDTSVPTPPVQPIPHGPGVTYGPGEPVNNPNNPTRGTSSALPSVQEIQQQFPDLGKNANHSAVQLDESGNFVDTSHNPSSPFQYNVSGGTIQDNKGNPLPLQTVYAILQKNPNLQSYISPQALGGAA